MHIYINTAEKSRTARSDKNTNCCPKRCDKTVTGYMFYHTSKTRSSAIAEGPRDASCQLKSCQLPRNSAETTYTTSPDQIDGMKLEI